MVGTRPLACDPATSLSFRTNFWRVRRFAQKNLVIETLGRLCEHETRVKTIQGCAEMRQRLPHFFSRALSGGTAALLTLLAPPCTLAKLISTPDMSCCAISGTACFAGSN